MVAELRTPTRRTSLHAKVSPRPWQKPNRKGACDRYKNKRLSDGIGKPFLLVGTTGFEPATSRTPSVRATRLRHVPSKPFQYGAKTFFVKHWVSLSATRILRVRFTGETPLPLDYFSFVRMA